MEQQYNWNELSQEQQTMVCQVHANAMGRKPQNATIKRIFNLGTPAVILGENNGEKYCRIAPQSVQIMKLLIREYLK